MLTERVTAESPQMGRTSFTEVYMAYAKFMKRVAMQKFRVSLEDADELVHDVFTTYLGHAPEDVTSVRAYLIVAICRAARRRTMRQRSEDERRSSASDTDICDLSTEKNLLLRMEVADALMSCSPRCRRLLYRHHMHGETAEEIAGSLSTTPQYVRQMLSACRKRIRDRIGPNLAT